MPALHEAQPVQGSHADLPQSRCDPRTGCFFRSRAALRRQRHRTHGVDIAQASAPRRMPRSFRQRFFFFPLSSRSPRFTFWRSANGAALAPGSQFRRGQAAGAGMPLTPSASPRSRTACLKSTRRSQRDAFPLRSPRLVVLASSQLLRTYLLLPRGNTARLALLHPPGNNPLEIMDVIGCRSSDGPQLHADHRTSTHSYSIALTCRNRLHPCTLCESCLLHYQHRGEGFVWSV